MGIRRILTFGLAVAAAFALSALPAAASPERTFGGPSGPFVVTAPGRWGGPNVRAFNPTEQAGNFVSNFMAYDPSFVGGVAVAAGDVDGDGYDDIVTGAGPGGGPHVNAYRADGLSHLRSFFAYDAGFTGGVFVAAGDVNGDGVADIITGPGPGGGPHVKVFDGANPANVLQSFYAYSPSFTGGVYVGAGDVNGDGKADIITGAGPGGGPHVQVFDGANPGSILKSFFAYDPGFTGGVFVAGGDVSCDGKADIVTGAGAGGGPHIKVFRGTDLALLHSLFVYDSGFRGGVRVASGDKNADGCAEVVTGAGPGGGPHVRVLELSGGSVTTVGTFFAYPASFTGGVYVGFGNG